MSDSIKTYVAVPEPKPNMTHIRVSVYYTKGGANYFSGGTTKRGYWVSWGPVECKDGCVSEMLFLGGGGSGGRVLLAEATRFNQKHLLAWSEKVAPVTQQIVDAAIAGEPNTAAAAVFPLRVGATPVTPKAAPVVAPEAPTTEGAVKHGQVILHGKLLKTPAYCYIRPSDDLPAIGATSELANTEVIARVKLFNPEGSWTWFVTEYDPETGECFGLVDGFEEELGYFDINELAGIRGKLLGLPLERDIHWTPRPLAECYREVRNKSAVTKSAGVSA